MSKTKFVVDKEKLEVRMERLYKASPKRLYRAMTEPDQIKQWWGPAQYEIIIVEDDLRVGGRWRYIHKDTGGQEHVFYGVYKEIQPQHKVVRTFEYEPWAGHVLIETATLEDQGDGTTLLKTVSKYANIEDLEGMVQSGMEKGAVEGTDRLAALVE